MRCIIAVGMSRAIRRATISVALVVLLTTGWLPQQRGPGGLESAIPAVDAQDQITAPTKPPPSTPLPAPPRQAPVPAGASDQGIARTGPAQQGSGQGQGSSQPPALSAEQQLQLQAMLDRASRRNAVQTPADPTAVSQAAAAPRVPDSQPAHMSQGAGAPSAAGTFQVIRDQDLGAGNGSLVNEPSTAITGQGAILQTWNWYSAISADGGYNWTYYNPSTLFPSVFGGFCCDQVAVYDPSQDMTIWVLQYHPDANHNNVERIVRFQRSADLVNVSYCYWDITPQQIGAATGNNYDQPRISLSSNYLYLMADQFDSSGYVRSVAMRFSLADLFSCGQGGTFAYGYYIPGLFSPNFVAGAPSTMYFAAHVSTSTLRVFSWPESGSVTSSNVNHTAYPAPSSGSPAACPRFGGSATSDWCHRAQDDRVLAGWVAGGVIGFGWNAAQGLGYNYPHVHFVRIDESTKALLNEPILSASNLAFLYPSLAVNSRGHIAGTVMYGGGSSSDYENCSFLINDAFSSPPPPWELYGATISNSDTNETVSGDYLSARRSATHPTTCASTCYALVGGGANGNVHSHWLWFGREQDVPPSNDFFGGTISVGPSLPTTVSTSTGNASKQYHEPTPSCQRFFGHSVWYKITPSTGQTLAIDTLGSSFDTVLAVYTGSSLVTLSEVACNDDIGGGDLHSRVTFPAAGGTTYWVQASGFSTGSGSLTVNFSPVRSPTSTATLTPTATPTSTLTATPTITPTPTRIPGDFNGDGFVDIRDYGMWRQQFGQANCGNPADADGNCLVDVRDYGLWRLYFGQGTPPDRRGGGLLPAGLAPAPRGTPGPALLGSDPAAAGGWGVLPAGDRLLSHRADQGRGVTGGRQ
jgi:hypothetical protein